MKTAIDAWRRQKKARTLRILKELVKRIESGQLEVSETGFWDSRLDNSINFRIKVFSRDSEKEIKRFEKLS